MIFTMLTQLWYYSTYYMCLQKKCNWFHYITVVFISKDTTHAELPKRALDDNRSISAKDHSGLSESVHAKRSKLRGFYHDKYWSHVKVSQGMAFVEDSVQEKAVQFKLWAIGDNVENMQDEFQMMRAFIAKKFPGDD